jgi:hypothetical protein
MAILQQPGTGLVTAEPPTREFKRYPLMMIHPAYQPGRPGLEVTSPLKVTYNLPGTAIRFAPVLVHNEKDEEYHKAQGYVENGTCSMDAFRQAVEGGYQSTTQHEVIMYPKWVKGKLVNSEEEEAALLGETSEPAGTPKLEAEVASLLERPDVAKPETREQRIARLKAELAAELEADEPTVQGNDAQLLADEAAAKKKAKSDKIKEGLARHRAKMAKAKAG